MWNTLRALDFFTSLHLTIFERPVESVFFNNQLNNVLPKFRAKPNKTFWDS